MTLNFNSLLYNLTKQLFEACRENGSMVLRSNFVGDTNDFHCIVNVDGFESGYVMERAGGRAKSVKHDQR